MMRIALSTAMALAPLAFADDCGSGAAPCGAPPHGQDSVLLQMRKPKVRRGNCSFMVDPETPFYWDEDCELGKVGCWADSLNVKCRFCSYDGVPCPPDAWHPSRVTCSFTNAPAAPYYWEPQCPEIDGGKGCKADGKHDGCRYCGGDGDYRDIECKEERCAFGNEPMIPYYYDEACTEGMLGCRADGNHTGCRFCGARPYNSIACPASAAVPEHACWFRNQPLVDYYWDPECALGLKGCWADGIHRQCRFCIKKANATGGGLGRAADRASAHYADIKCPEA